MSQFIDSEKDLSEDLVVLTYNTHLFGGSNADYANQARIKFAKKFPWIAKRFPDIFKDISDIIYMDKERAENILNKVKGCDAHIVALQEVWACDRQKWFAEELKNTYPYTYHYREHCKNPDATITEILAKLVEALGMHKNEESYDSDLIQEVLEHFKNNSGLLLLSKYPLETTETEFHEFPPGRTEKKQEDGLARKGVITTTVKLPDGSSLRVGITHATTDTVNRDVQDIRDLAKWATIKIGPAIMMGDFNVGYKNYKDMADFFKKTYGAIDAYREATGNEFNDPTSDHEANKLYLKFTEHPDSEKNCIDYVFLRPNGSGLKLVPKSAKVITDWNYGTDHIDLSDHYPVKVTFSVTFE